MSFFYLRQSSDLISKRISPLLFCLFSLWDCLHSTRGWELGADPGHRGCQALSGVPSHTSGWLAATAWAAGCRRTAVFSPGTAENPRLNAVWAHWRKHRRTAGSGGPAALHRGPRVRAGQVPPAAVCGHSRASGTALDGSRQAPAFSRGFTPPASLTAPHGGLKRAPWAEWSRHWACEDQGQQPMPCSPGTSAWSLGCPGFTFPKPRRNSAA